jgi:peptidoglycan/xylan/chitin deacetylase (PgdA/CDA1 family)
VLAYHHVGDPNRLAPWVTVSPERFAEQMAFLAEARLALPLDRLLADLRRGRLPRGGHVVVTFDDAAADTYAVAYPILRRHGVPATLFVPTGLVGKAGPFWWDRLFRLGRRAAARGGDLGPALLGGPVEDDDALWRRFRFLDEEQRQEALDRAAAWLGEEVELGPGAMSWDQLAEMAGDPLITLGAHTVSHPVLAALDDEQLAAEVAGSRDALACFGSFRRVFAYPYGDDAAIGPRARQAVGAAGLEAAFTTRETALTGREDRLALGRVCIDEMTLAAFRWTIDRFLGL